MPFSSTRAARQQLPVQGVGEVSVIYRSQVGLGSRGVGLNKHTVTLQVLPVLGLSYLSWGRAPETGGTSSIAGLGVYGLGFRRMLCIGLESSVIPEFCDILW